MRDPLPKVWRTINRAAWVIWAGAVVWHTYRHETAEATFALLWVIALDVSFRDRSET